MDIDPIEPAIPNHMDWEEDAEMPNSEIHGFSKKPPIGSGAMAQLSGPQLSAGRPATAETTSEIDIQKPRTRKGNVVAQLEALQVAHK